MIILHAAFVERRFLLWGEAPAETDAIPQPKRRGRKAKNRPAANLPFAAGATGLYGALAGIGIAADQSLLIPLEAAWKGKGAAARHLKRPGFHPHEFILAALGRAAAVSPAIAASLKGSAPDGCTLEVNGAYEFLCVTAPALEQAGFVVLLPSWWSRRGPRQRLSARAMVQGKKSASGMGLSLDEIIQFNWELALGEETITLKELQELARLKSPLVKLRGQWIQVGAEEIRNAIAFLKKRGGETATARDLLRMAMGQGEAPGGIDLAGVRADGWFGELLAQLQGGVPFGELPQPAGLHGSLRPYQAAGKKGMKGELSAAFYPFKRYRSP